MTGIIMLLSLMLATQHIAALRPLPGAGAPSHPDDEDQGAGRNGITMDGSGSTGAGSNTPTTPGVDSETARLLDGPSSHGPSSSTNRSGGGGSTT